MATQAFAGPVNVRSPSGASGQGSYKLDTLLAAGNVDLTALGSPTYPYVARSVLVDLGGTFTFAAADGSVDTWTLLSGILYPLEVAYVFQTGTAATGIHVVT